MFDSGMWWLVTLWYLKLFLPNNDFLYLGDTAYMPYGDKSSSFLETRTFSCLHWMFENWCKIVILACNTASAHSIRKRQTMYPFKKVLSITLPWVEAIIDSKYKKPLLIATKSTVTSGIYEKALLRLWYKVDSFISIQWNWLASLIEKWANELEIIKKIESYSLQNFDYDCIVLWCTHYPLIIDSLKKIVGDDIDYIDPSFKASEKLPLYLEKHKELWITLSWNKTVTYYVTWIGYWYNENVVVI